MKIADIEITHAERVMFGDAGITKGDVVAYYDRIAPLMLPELRRRPLTIERYTKGVEAGGFFQKHYQKHYPAWIDSLEIPSKTTVRYPLCDTHQGLVYFANQGGVAYHVIGARADAIGSPDICVFDLDPPEKGFELVRRAALILRDLLPALGLPAFVKTTGSKGLHVCVPLDGQGTWDELAAFCNAVAKAMCTQYPDLFTVEFYKKDRKGRLYFDTERNRLGATFIAAYSLRGKPGAPISMPIPWALVDDPALTPNGFTLRNAEPIDVWADFRKREGNLATALQKIAENE